uniref:Structural polyprotein n=1 Tax=Riboviria sp. TaxID=2585031 RepID=A0A893ABA3_9VIRU|nr:MAG: hypothetical protein 2 [Riboviria sp.]
MTPMQTQSEDVVTSLETVEFVDTTLGDMSAGLATTDTAFIGDDEVDNATLAKFLARPVRIANVSWSLADAANKTHFLISPWHLFMSDPRIKRKLDNFAFFRGNLKLKVVVNASPFYSGYALVSYQPLPVYTPSTLGLATEGIRMQLSQRPHLWVNAQANEAGEMTLPFFWPKNWLPLKDALAAQQLGSLRMDSFTLLRSANAAVTNPVTVQVYAWLEDVKLSGSTLSLSMQSKDEYGTGPVSAPASALAKVAASLEPTFGRFATATRMIATTTSDVAKLFGFTNVPVLEPATPMRIAQTPNFASPDIGYPVNKLTVDSKNELSIDPTLLGLPNEDEMSIQHLVTKPSYFTQIDWDTTQSVDTILLYQKVTAAMGQRLASGAQDTYHTTPMGFVAQMFKAWRGDIKFTFKVTSTRYHKGRLRFTYDPQGDAINNPVTVADGSSGAYTVFLDLAESAEVSIVIPYQQALPFLKTRLDSEVMNYGTFAPGPTPTYNTNTDLQNGSFVVRVATELSAPVDTSSVSILMFVEGCENVEFANPATLSPQLSPFVVQSQDIVLGTDIADKRTQRGLMNYGEVIRSLRPLVRRASSTSPFSFVIAGTGMQRITWGHGKIPPYPGYDPGSIYTGVKKNSAGNAPATWANMSYMQYVMLAFVGYRGSTFWYHTPQLAYSVTKAPPIYRATRKPNGGVFNVSATNTALSATSSSVNALAQLVENDSAGTVQMLMDIEGSIPVQVPNQSRYLFQSTDFRSPTVASTADDSYNDYVEMSTYGGSGVQNTSTNVGTWVQSYCGAGTDFTCHFFLNTPTLYYSTVIIPV